MPKIGVYFTDEEAAFVKEQPKGFIRDIVQDRIVQGSGSGMFVSLSEEELAYVRDREAKNGAGWFSRVAQINMKAAKDNRPPFYWLKPEGFEEI